MEGTAEMVGMEETVEMEGMEGTVEMEGTADANQRPMKEELGDDRQLAIGMVVLEVFQGILGDRQEVEMEVKSSEDGNLMKKDKDRHAREKLNYTFDKWKLAWNGRLNSNHYRRETCKFSSKRS